MKKTRLVLLVLAVVITSLCLYRIYLEKMILIEFSDEGDIISDGGGPYVEDNQGVIIEIDRSYRAESVFLNIHDSPRSVSVRFLDVVWKDVDLRDKPPRLSSKRYSIVLNIVIDLGIENSTLAKMGIGERLEPTIIDIIFYDKDTGVIQGSASRTSPRLTPALKPPGELHEEGHAYIIKEREDSWTLDVDAWFEMIIDPTTYYVKLDFSMTLKIKGLL